MRCHICDAHLDDVKIDEKGKVLPCDTCASVIADTVESYDLYSYLLLDIDFDLDEYLDIETKEDRTPETIGHSDK